MAARYEKIIINFLWVHLFDLFAFSIQLEADTQLSQNWIETFFQHRPTDGRYEAVKYQAFHSVESLTNANQVTFQCPRFLGPNAYLPDKLMIKVQLEIVDVATNQVPVAAQRVAPINNSLHSLFSSCRVWLGETQITKSSENYAHRAYLIDLLSFDGFAKYSYLEAQGWFQDVFGEKLVNQTSDTNSGFNNRRRLFLIDSSNATSNYSPGGIILMGRLHTDLVGAECGLIPGVGMRVQLGFNSSAFVLQKPPSDTATYKAIIKNATLFCPVGQLNPEVFRQMEAKLNKQDARLYIQRSEVTNKNIPLNSTIFVEPLFAGAPLPSRMFIAFVATPNYLGSQTTNPFFFQRRWKKTPAPTPPGPGISSVPAETGSSGTAVGSGWTIPGIQITVGTGSSVPPTSGISGDPNEDEVVEQNVTGIDDYVYIERVSVTLNGEQLDGLEEGTATAASDMANYVRLHLTLGLLTSTTGNNLTLDEFHRGFFILAYDLTTSADSTAENIVPAVRQGNLNIQVTFSEPTPVELTMLIYAEYPTVIKMDKNRQIRMSY